MRMKVLMLQQEQLKNLIDTVPDKVLIFSKTSEASAPKSLYSNHRMNEFFGCNVVEKDKLAKGKRLNAPTWRKLFEKTEG